jgi:hypothetical protein
MSLTNASHKEELRAAGWYTRGYLPHFDGRAIPQFITLRLADSIPSSVIERWRTELARLDQQHQRTIMQKRIEKYLDMGYGQCFLRDPRIATMVQNSLLQFDSIRYNLFAWVVMPNHTHSLLSRFEHWELQQLMQSHKSYTAHQANKILNRAGPMWMKEYFDRYISQC